MNTITAENYFINTSGLFDVVDNNSEEFKKIMDLKPNHENIYIPRRHWDEKIHYDSVNLLTEKQIEELDESLSEWGVIGFVANFPDNDDDGGYDGYIFEECGEMIFHGKDLPELKSKTWLHDGYVYRYSYYWGKIATCNWNLNIPNFEDGDQDNFVLAKCRLEDLFFIEMKFNKKELLETYQFRVRTVCETRYFYAYPKGVKFYPDFSYVMDNIEDDNSMIHLIAEAIDRFYRNEKPIVDIDGDWALVLTKQQIKITEDKDRMKFVYFELCDELWENIKQKQLKN